MRLVTIECGAILFDMDGTLVNSTAIVERQWARFAERYGLDYAHIMKISHGRRNSETIRDIAPHLATPEILARFDEEELLDRGGAKAVPGAERLLTGIPNSAWAVVTSASRELAAVRLQDAGLPLPTILIGADSVLRGKPHPESYLLAAQKLGADPIRCLVFEDTPAGLEAAAAAGMRAIGITTTYARKSLPVSDCAEDFTSAEVERHSSGLRLSINCY